MKKCRVAAFRADLEPKTCRKKQLGFAIQEVAPGRDKKLPLQLAQEDSEEDAIIHDATVRFQLGVVSLSNADFNKAHENFSLALKARVALYGPRHKQCALAHEHLGDVEGTRGNYQDAHHHYSAAVSAYMCGTDTNSKLLEKELHKTASQILIKKAKLYVATKDVKDALYTYSQALSFLRLFGGDQRKEEIELLGELGQLALEHGYEECASTIFASVVESASPKEVMSHGQIFQKLYFILGLVAERNMDYDGAIERFMKSLESGKKILGAHPDIGEVLRHLGFVHYQRNDFDNALLCFGEAMDIVCATGIVEAHVRMITESQIKIHRRAGRVDLVIDLLKDLAECLVKVHECENCKGIADCYGALGKTCLEVGRTREAIRYFKKVGKILNAIGADPSAVAEVMIRIGNVYRRDGESSSAIEFFRGALHTLAKSGQSSECLASITGDGSNLRETLAQCVSVLKSSDFNACLLPVSDVADTANDLGNLYLSVGDAGNAVDCYRCAMEIMSDCSLYCDEEEYLRTRYNLASALARNGKVDEARDMFSIVLDSQESVHGPESLEVANTLNQLGNIDLARGSVLTATLLYKRALTLKKAKLGPCAPEVIGTMSNLGLAYCRIGSCYKASRELERVLQLQQASEEPDALGIADTLALLGHVWVQSGDYDRALDSFSRAATIRSEQLGRDDPLVAQTLTFLADTHLARKEYKDCATTCRDALLIFRKCRSKADHADIAHVAKTMRQLDRSLAQLQVIRKQQRSRALRILSF